VDRGGAPLGRELPHPEHIFEADDVLYRSQLVPLAAIKAVLGTNADSHAADKTLCRWYWSGMLGGLYQAPEALMNRTRPARRHCRAAPSRVTSPRQWLWQPDAWLDMAGSSARLTAAGVD
jgi:hypothetical protein